MEAYDPRLQMFLRALEAEDRKMADTLPLDPEGAPATPLSQSTRRSWEDRDWLVRYAVRDSRAFDFV